MSSVLKKTKKNSVADLVTALNKFIYLLEGQKEFDAVQDLRIASADIQKYQPESEEFQSAIRLLVDAYEGEHELKAYTLRRQKSESEWTEADDLYLASIEVLNLANRLSLSEA